MKVVLFLYLATHGWIEFERYETFTECNKVAHHIMESNERVEGLCCKPEGARCITRDVMK